MNSSYLNMVLFAKVLDVSWRYDSSVSRSLGTRSTLISVTGGGTETAFGWLLEHLSGLTTIARFCCGGAFFIRSSHSLKRNLFHPGCSRILDVGCGMIRLGRQETIGVLFPHILYFLNRRVLTRTTSSKSFTHMDEESSKVLACFRILITDRSTEVSSQTKEFLISYFCGFIGKGRK